MGHVNGDHKIAFGTGKNGRVLFVDIGDLNGRRCLALFGATQIGDAEAYEGHVVMTNTDGSTSPEAFPVEFSVRAGQEDRAIAAGISAAAYVADRSVMPDWDGVSIAYMETLTDITKRLRDFSGVDPQNAQRPDPRVIRTSLPTVAFRPSRQDQKKDPDAKRIFTPAPQELGIRIGDPESAFAAMAAARKVAAPAGKVGFGKILAPDIDAEAAQTALQAVAGPSVSAADFYGGAGLRREDGQDTRFGDRQQAAKSYPVLADLIAAAPDLTKAVDAREAVQPLIIEKTGLTKGALKRLAKVTAPFDAAAVAGEERVVTNKDQLGVNRQSKFIVRGNLTLNQALEHLRDLPPDWVPDTNESWKAFADILGGLAVPLSQVTGKSVKDLLSSAKGDWVGFKATLAKAADVPVDKFDRPQMAALAGEIMTMTETFARTAILPMIASVMERAGHAATVQRSQDVIDNALERAVAATPGIIIGRAKSPMVALLEAERRFISRDTTIAGLSLGMDEEERAERAVQMTDKEREMGDMAGNKAFPVLRETWVAPNGYVVEPLRNEAAMQTEGALMGHCVGGHHRAYGSSGAYHYFSVYHPDTMNDPRQRGTLRIHPISPGSTIQEGEFRSYHNGAVSAACRQAFKDWTASFLQEDLDAAGARMDEWRAWRRAHGLDSSKTARTPDQIWEGRIGVKTADPNVVTALWQEWAENVLSGWPTETPEVMFRDANVREILSTASPASAQFLVEEAAARKAEAKAAEPEMAGPGM